jgi:hypothetical protein
VFRVPASDCYVTNLSVSDGKLAAVMSDGDRRKVRVYGLK